MKEKIKDTIATIIMIGGITFLTLSLMQLWEIQKEIKEIREDVQKISEKIESLHERNISIPMQTYDRLLTLKTTLDEYLESERLK